MNSQIIMDTHNHDSSVRDYYHPQGSNKDYHLANYRIYKENNNHQNPHLQQQNPYASMDQTFHTPSFGDEDFNISPSSYHHPPLDPSHMPPQQQQQYQMAPPSHDQYHHQWHHDQSQAPQMYMPQYIPNNNMGASSQQHSMQSPLHHSQLQQATSQQQQQQQHISPQHVGGSPYVGHAGTTHQQSPPQGRPSPLEHNGTSEDSDDAIPATTLKRPSPDPYLETNGKGGVAANKKAKVPKKKKKKDPNEPQKPVSAYALFFRDTQAAIKGTTPNATFGEVSKIVASMWDVLDADNKSVYKKRTEVAKKEYLKALAAYRANAVSKESGGSDQSPTNMYSPPHEQAQHQQMQQQHHPPPQSPHAMHQSPQQHMPTPQQMQSPPQQLHPHHPHTQYQYSSPPMQQMGPPQMSSPNQMMEQHHHWGQQGPQQPQQPSQMTAPGAIVSQQQPPSQQQSMPGPPQLCIRDGCRNPAISNSDWEDEYCSNECVITHCRDVFGNWVQQQSYSAVK